MNTEQGIFGAGVGKAERIITNITKTERAFGRGLSALGIAMTFNSEYQRADAALKEQWPGFLDGGRFLKAGEKTTVRTGPQVGVATGTGALIGSVLLMGGVAVGFTVGLGVGVLMMALTGDERSIRNRFAGLEEWG